MLLVVAIQHFHAPAPAKALLAAAPFVGMILAPAIVTGVAARGMPVRSGLGRLMVVSGFALALSAASPGLTGFLVGAVLGVPLAHAIQPLVTAIWQAHVPNRFRGRLFGIVNSVAALAGIVSGLAIAVYIGDQPSRYRPVVLALALGLVLAGLVSFRLPAGVLDRSVRNPVRLLGLLVRHRRFGYLSLAWMLLGFGNLSTIPLRVEYLASSTHGLAYSAGHVLLLTTVVPQMVNLIATMAWGRLFDRVDFLWLRVALNLVFMSSIVLFFTPVPSVQLLGSVLFGVGLGGGAIQWNLWVTRYAPPGRTADYMAVHTFLTGVRGLAAPFLAYALLDRMDLVATTRFGFALLGIATVLVLALIWRDRRRT